VEELAATAKDEFCVGPTAIAPPVEVLLFHPHPAVQISTEGKLKDDHKEVSEDMRALSVPKPNNVYLLA
jgi:vacuolar-type H+-ATPase subunit B/Vma2